MRRAEISAVPMAVVRSARDGCIFDGLAFRVGAPNFSYTATRGAIRRAIRDQPWVVWTARVKPYLLGSLRAQRLHLDSSDSAGLCGNAICEGSAMDRNSIGTRQRKCARERK